MNSGKSIGGSRPHVALLVETSLASGRDILRGIARYVREHGNWALYHEARSLEESVPPWLVRWRGQGVIARIQNQKMARALRKTGLPTVDVLGVVEEAGFPLVHVDDARIAEMAAQHLLERGFHHFGYFGIAGENWSQRRRDAFAKAVRDSGNWVGVYELGRRISRRGSWEKVEDELARWVSRLPKPAGIMVCSDQRGVLVLEACRRAGVAVPDEVAVIGVDNDEPLCEVSNPPLSSIAANHELVGYQAAALLERLMHGEAPPSEPVLIRPAGVVQRLSSETLAIEDRHLAAALRFIRENACSGISVDQVARAAGLSRSVLQRRFHTMLRRTVHQEIIQARLKRACELLANTDLPLIEVAERAGFKHQEYLSAVLKKRLGQTPAQYRKSLLGKQPSIGLAARNAN